MSVCFYADLLVYFLAGFLLVLLWKGPRSPRPRTEPESPTKVSTKVYIQAFVVGLVIAGSRYGLQSLLSRRALQKVQGMLETATVPKLGELDFLNKPVE